jgi:hypothetical protein
MAHSSMQGRSERKRKNSSCLSRSLNREKEGSNLFSKPELLRPIFPLFSFFEGTFLFLDSPFDTDHIGTVNVCLETRSKLIEEERKCVFVCERVSVKMCVSECRVRVCMRV